MKELYSLRVYGLAGKVRNITLQRSGTIPSVSKCGAGRVRRRAVAHDVLDRVSSQFMAGKLPSHSTV